MYIGRFLIAAPDSAAYRVSSRSFPNRQVIERAGNLAVVPTDDAEPTTNPYVSYHCLRVGAKHATIGNGAHVDPIAEKLELGYPARDALALSLLSLDYEKDDYNTPRIAAVIGDEPTIGVVREDGLHVKTIDEPTLVATYEHDDPHPVSYQWDSAEAAAQGVYALEYEHPVCAAAVTRESEGFDIATYNGSGTD